MKILYVSPVSVTIELENEEIYYNSSSFDVYLNSKIVLSNESKNVFSIFNLEPNAHYLLKVLGEKIDFETPNVSEIIEVSESDDIQEAINNVQDNGLININAGIYHITSLFLKDNITINLKKDAILKGNTNINDYAEFPKYYSLKDGSKAILGTFEGEAKEHMKCSIINGIDVNNVNLVGEGIINGQAQLSSWWIDTKHLPYVRPHLLYLNHAKNINVVGLTFKNSPQWSIHPFFCMNTNFYNLSINNPKVSPNTDGINPQCSKNVSIIGVHFSVGDDCIAIKSGKISLSKEYDNPSENITIRNCLMQYGHGGIVLGSEMSLGIKNITCERCLFDHTDRGLRIKSCRGRGNKGIIDGIHFKNIKMDYVLAPLVINMYYNCDPDGNSDYIASFNPQIVDERTPYLGSFTFENIMAYNVSYCAGFFYGLAEQLIKKISIINSTFEFNVNAVTGKPAMLKEDIECVRKGFLIRGVNSFRLDNVNVINNIGDLVDIADKESEGLVNGKQCRHNL